MYLYVPLHKVSSPTSAFFTQKELHQYLLVVALCLFAFSVGLFSHHLHMLLSRPALQCNTRSAKQFHTKQWKIFGYCFLYCRSRALSEATESKGGDP